MSDLLPRIFGPYVLVRRIGVGAAGQVYLARTWSGEAFGAPAVIKVLHQEASADPHHTKRFKHEASVAVRVDHPNVVKVYDAGRVDDAFYIAMEYVAGSPLRELHAQAHDAGRVVPLRVALSIVMQILDGLTALHEAKDRTGAPIHFIHRDISPNNVLIDRDGVVRLIDLGLGKSALRDWRTHTGVTMGSAGYMPPEQAVGEAVTLQADIYAVGVILYELVTGQRMIAPGPPLEMLRATLTHQLVPPSTVRPECPPALDAVLQRALHKRPTSRFESAREFAKALSETSRDRAPSAEVGGFTRSLLGEPDDISAGLEDFRAPDDEPAHPTEVFAHRPRTDAPVFLPATPALLVSLQPPRPRADRGLRIALLVVVALVVGTTALWMTRPAEILVVPVVADAPLVAAPAVTVIPHPSAEKAPTPEPEVRPPPRSLPVVERTPRRVAPVASAPPPRIAAPSLGMQPTLTERIRSVEARARSIRARLPADAPASESVNLVFADLALVEGAVSEDPQRAARQLVELEARLSVLERQSR